MVRQQFDSSNESVSSKGAELLIEERYSCCFCWNVVTGSFFIGILGFATSLFFLLAMLLAHFNYNAVPASIGLFNYSFLIVAEFTRRPSFYLAFIIINALGILFYGSLSLFLVVMLIQMPNWYQTFMRHHVVERGNMIYSLEVVKMVTSLNLGFYFLGVIFSLYVTYVVYKAYKFTLELRDRRNQDYCQYVHS